jgi:plastocyanin
MLLALPLLAAVVAAAPQATSTYLPTGDAAKVVTVTPDGQAQARVIVLTEPIAIKETGPKATVQTFGEVYAFSPTLFVVHRDEPTRVEFWNLQGDDEHDFMLMDPHWTVLMKVQLPALQKRSWVFTFHKEGLYNFSCVVHQPAMNGQVLVLPPAAPPGQ